MERRVFLKRGCLALGALTCIPFAFPGLFRRLSPTIAAGGVTKRGRTFVCLFLRGAVDGLSMLVPHADENYYQARPSLAIPRPSRNSKAGTAIDLDGRFGLHPALADLVPLFREARAVAIPACGSPSPTRSHFDAQEHMESGTIGGRPEQRGWLARALQHAPNPSAELRTIALSPSMPKTLLGVENELAIPNLRAARLGKVTHAFEQMYRGSELYHEISKEAFDTVRLLEQVEKGRKGASRAHKYPHGRLGQSLRQIAMLIKADVGLEAAFAECDGWDTHIRQGASHGLLARMFSDLGAGLSAFFHDLGDRADDVVLVTMSEFGRTVAENATAGTDHGHGTCFLALGGNLSRGGVLGQWPGLAVEQRYEGRDLAVTTDYRDVLAEIIERHLGIDQPGTIFPGYSVSRDRYCNFLNT